MSSVSPILTAVRWSLKTVVILDNGAALDEAGLRHQLAAELSAYKIPRRLATILAADVPLLASGKADVQQLKRLFDG